MQIMELCTGLLVLNAGGHTQVKAEHDEIYVISSGRPLRDASKELLRTLGWVYDGHMSAWTAQVGS